MSDTDQEQAQRDRDIEAMRACVKHARDLLDSARAVVGVGHPNIAFHLALLSLEELGRRVLIGLQRLAEKSGKDKPWQKHAQMHTKKIFWCMFGLQFMRGEFTAGRFDGIQSFAKNLHDKRMLGLYVEYADDNLHIPAEAIDEAYCNELIALAEAQIKMAELEVPRAPTEEESDLQLWFLSTMENPENVKMIFSVASLAKLTELKDAKVWALWLRDLFAQAEAQAAQYLEQELERSKNLPAKGTKPKWQLRIRIVSQSHTVRQKELNQWNSGADWIKLTAVPEKPNQLIVEFLLQDNMPAGAPLWWFGWGLARHFVTALNIATMGFWWWHMPEDVNSYYESLTDLENNRRLEITRSPALKMDWGDKRRLTEADLFNTSICFTALPAPKDREQHTPYNSYVTGLNFLSLNDVHWQCETWVFGNFFESLKAMMMQTGELALDADPVPALQKFILGITPDMNDIDRFKELFEVFEKRRKTGTVVNLQEATNMKLYCDAYFLHRIAKPVAEAARAKRQETAG